MLKMMILGALLSCSFVSLAGTTCRTDSFGTVRCHGKTSEGQPTNTVTRTDSFGTERTTGRIGDKLIKKTCKTNSFGSTYCH